MGDWITVELYFVDCGFTLLSLSHVKVYVAGYDISRQPFEAFQHMGFCPQTDVLWPIVTLQEHLEVFARIRGVPWGEVKRLVEQ